MAITLASAKPSMASLRNATRRLLDRLAELGPLEGSRLAETLAKELAADLRKAAVVRTCREARRAESRPQATVFDQAGREPEVRQLCRHPAARRLPSNRRLEDHAAGAALEGA